jgi:hypothetical protein
MVVGFMFAKNEYSKKLALAELENKTQNQIRSDLDKYKADYLVLVAEEKENNLKKMAETKTTYDFLIQDQANILAEHRKQIAVADNTTTSSSNTAVSNNGSNTTTVKKTVSKPSTTRTTKTS